MIKGKRILVVVPARGGSKGIPLKNLSLFLGQPLVSVAGKLASKISGVDRKIVSTDHPEIAKFAKASGLDAPFMREPKLSGDRISDHEVLIDALEKTENLDKIKYDIIVMLQPTSPLRTAAQVTGCIEHCISQNWDAVWSISKADKKFHPLKQLKIRDNGGLDYYDSNGSSIIARQQLEPLYYRNGVAYVITRECLVSQNSIKGKRTGYVITDGDHLSIDTVDDLKIANEIGKKLKIKNSDTGFAEEKN